MARPIRCRRVCAEPECRGFAPQIVTGIGTVILTVDEYEVIRLVDYESEPMSSVRRRWKFPEQQ